MRARSIVCVAGLMLSALAFGPHATARAAGGCPAGRAAVANVAYVIFHPDGSSQNTRYLHGHVHLGDHVNVLFDVPPLPGGCAQVQLSVASYSSPVPATDLRHQHLYSSQSGEFLPGGRYEMSAMVIPPPAGGTVYFQLDFTTGPVLTPPHYGPLLIAATKG